MKNRLIHSLLIVCLLAPLPSLAGSYDKIVVFGDSLSDSGNLAGLPEFEFLNDKPYQQAFTNGPTAVVKLAKLLGAKELKPSQYLQKKIVGTNFAVAGARAAGDNPIDLNAQVGAFLLSEGGNAPNNALYILFIGGNDIRDMRDASDIKTVSSVLNKATQNIHNNLSLLIASGAKHIMVVNSADIGSLPETKALAAQNPKLIWRASLFTQAYNSSLADTVKHIEKQTNVDLVLFDLFTLFNNIIHDSHAFLFTNAKAACYSSVGFDYYPICDKSKLDTFVYFDEIHPTRRVHDRVGRAMFAVVPEAD